jgi:hypothetical protein
VRSFSHEKVSFLEILTVAIGLTLCVILQLALCNAFSLFSRYFWVDELFTYRLVSDPDFLRAMRGIQAGVDLTVPGLHLLLRAFTALVGSTAEAVFRSFALLSMLLALLGVYVSLRQIASILVATTAMLAIWSHPLVFYHAFEARFYGPWFAGIVWFSYFLGRARMSPGNFCNLALLGLSSLLVCLVHYFGIVSLLLVVAGEFLLRRIRTTTPARLAAAIAPGPLALAICVPLFLMHQRTISAVTWLPAATLQQIATFSTTLLLPNSLAAVVMVIWLSQLLRGSEAEARPWLYAKPDWTTLAGLSATVLMVPALLVYSFLVRPVLINRYAFPAIASLAGAVGFVIAPAHRLLTIALCCFFLLFSARGIHFNAQNFRERDQQTREFIAHIYNQTDKAPLLFEDLHAFYTLCHYAPDVADRCFYLDFDKGQLEHADKNTLQTWHRNFARAYARVYPDRGLIHWTNLYRYKEVYLIVYKEKIENLPRASALLHEQYPGFIAQHVYGQLFRLVPEKG